MNRNICPSVMRPVCPEETYNALKHNQKPLKIAERKAYKKIKIKT